MSAALDPVAEASVVVACQRLIARLTQLTDAGEVAAAAGLFTEDAVFARPSAPDEPIVGRAAILEHLSARPPERLTRHLVCNTVVIAASETEAHVESYVLLVSAPARGPGLPSAQPPHHLGSYRDHLVREPDGQWRFKARHGQMTMVIPA